MRRYMIDFEEYESGILRDIQSNIETDTDKSMLADEWLAFSMMRGRGPSDPPTILDTWAYGFQDRHRSVVDTEE